MTHTFYNPFHFIPFNDKAHAQNNGLDYNTIKTGQTHVTHQGWQANTLSGAIYIALTNKSGLIVGDGAPHDDKDAPADTVRFYRTTTPATPGTPQLSIPANSLRGMVACTAEIISDSAMRVINDTHYSSRVTASSDNTFSTLGLIVRENDELKLKPLNLGRLTLTDKSGLPEFNQEYNDGVLDECCYQNTEFWEDFLIYHVHCYNNICGKSVEVTENFLSRLNVPLECYHHNDNNPKFIFIKKKYEFTSIADSLCESGYPGKLKIDQIKNNEYMLSGLHLPADEADDAFFGTSQEFLQHINVNPSLNKNDFIKCILYCKGDIEKRDAQLPATKLYEYLIPFSDEKLASTTAFTIPKEVLERFNAILNNNRHNNLIPNNWKKHKKGDIHHVEEGDIYYFKLDCEKEIITELSLSQIWRKEVTGQSTYGIMKNAGHDHYLPWGQRSDTQTLTPAECVFGAVETLPETAGNNHQAGRALASRVRFYDAVKLNADLATRLSRPLTLSSPKPPSPSLYLSSPKGQGLGKNQITDEKTAFSLSGRKRYLQHTQEQTRGTTGTDAMDTIAEVVPASTTPAFGFHIEFDNLTQEELSLLLASLGAKQNTGIPTFHQQLGMGKPYGYGKVELDILGVFLKQPQQRYSTLETSPVYQQVLSGYQPNAEQQQWLTTMQAQQCQPALAQYLADLEQQSLHAHPVALSEHPALNHADNPLIVQTALQQVAMLADENNFTDAPISYPLPGGQRSDAKIFEWFVNNEKHLNPKNKSQHRYQSLKPLRGNTPPKPLINN